MKKLYLVLLCSMMIAKTFAQSSYEDSMRLFLKNYIGKHEVVKGDDRKALHFFEVDPKFRVLASFQKSETAQWFQMPTTGPIKKIYKIYGILKFKINDSLVQLNAYQSQDLLQSDEYKNYLFLPFTDATTGRETYEGGRYIDFEIKDIKNNQVVIDFNKAYNPYCAYVSGKYNCPIPPRENHLVV